MARVLCIGGVFFRCADPDGTRDWYVENLGLPKDELGFVVLPWTREAPGLKAATVWAPFAADTGYFDAPEGGQPSEFMINYLVDDLDGMRAQLEAKGVTVLPQVEEMKGIGRFGYAVDCDGRKFELWEPERED